MKNIVRNFTKNINYKDGISTSILQKAVYIEK